MSVSFSLLQALGLGERIMTRMSHAMDPAIGSFDPAFYRDNFVGQGNCGGSKQTPIQLPSGFISALGEERFTSFNMPKVRGAKIVNRGTGVEVRTAPSLRNEIGKECLRSARISKIRPPSGGKRSAMATSARAPNRTLNPDSCGPLVCIKKGCVTIGF